MMALHARLFNVTFLLLALLVPSHAFAQAVSDLPRAEYYVARELYGAGRTVDAGAGFETALARARRIGDLRWVDSIPPLVMLGECHYQQGNLTLALAQYEAALNLLIANSNWIDQIEVGTEQLPPLENLAKAPRWFARAQLSTPVAVPEGVEISIDPTQAQAAPDGTIIAPISLLTRLDATEILNMTGLAMMRRAQLLGPLTEHAPLSASLEQLFSRNTRHQVPWLLSSWSVLRGISGMNAQIGIDGPQRLRDGVLIQGAFDYFMSPLALLVLGQRDAQEGKYQAAVANLQEAALLAALFEQHALLAESLQALSDCAVASARTDLLAPLEAAATWTAKRSKIAQVSALLGVAELSTFSGNFVQSEKALTQCMVTLRTRDVVLPRIRAQSSFVAALNGFAQDRGASGLTNLEDALKIMHGSAQTGPAIPRVFQTQQTLDLYAAGQLSASDTEQVLLEVLAEPNAFDWQNSPLETLATITTASLPAYERLLQLAVGRQAAAEILVRMDRLQRQRLYEALPLGGRLFSWRIAATADPQSLSADARQILQMSNQRTPRLSAIPQEIKSLVDTLRQGPLPLDERVLSAELRKTFSQLEELSESYENLLAFHSVSRIPLERFTPGPASIEKTQETLGPQDLVLCLVAAGGQVFGAAISKDAVELWQVADAAVLSAKLQVLLSEIGLVRGQAADTPSAANAPDAAWRKTANDLEQLLFPTQVQSMVAAATRLIIVPNAQFWYLPFEILPENGNPGAPWLASRAITYLPTLDAVPLAFAGRSAPRDTVGLVNSFFSIDKDENKQQADLLANRAPNTAKIFLTQKSTVPSSLWIRLRAEQLWAAAKIESNVTGWDAIPIPLDKSRPQSLGSWLRTPRVAPARVFLPGYESSMRSGNLLQGDDLLLPAFSLLYGGSKSAILSRWSTGGKSAQRLIARCLEEMNDESASTALRRSVLALWAEDFLTADEPILLPAGKEANPLTSGTHPLLWSGYISIGDSVP
jgi:tetratricopeptide (TPR) repeat protein